MLKFARDRNRWLDLLFRAKQKYGLDVLNYSRLMELLGFESLDVLKEAHGQWIEDSLKYLNIDSQILKHSEYLIRIQKETEKEDVVIKKA